MSCFHILTIQVTLILIYLHGYLQGSGNSHSFPPNCTNILNMYNTSIFGPTKLRWKKEVNNWKRKNNCKEIDEIGFIKIFKIMKSRIITKPKIIGGFRGTGIFPLKIENVTFI